MLTSALVALGPAVILGLGMLILSIVGRQIPRTLVIFHLGLVVFGLSILIVGSLLDPGPWTWAMVITFGLAGMVGVFLLDKVLRKSKIPTWGVLAQVLLELAGLWCLYPWTGRGF